ncbi:protein ABHD18 isoform X2 [Tribolium madens]|uniref:protein ABHD18 isoform X2 n=1 Tax=Tribolium madens TaxID=41895 RepID=UPI001CF74F4B|nr:protein ABHD18 isoform X2 [Tribolium madens]
MPVSRLDVIYRKILLTKFFTKGWGNPENLIELFNFRKLVSNRNACYELLPKDYPVEIINAQRFSEFQILEGRLWTPFRMFLPSLLVPEIQQVYFQMILPLKWPSKDYRPLCIHLAGTGDHYFWRRRNFMAKPLLQAGIGSLILENPYYGTRKPQDQLRSSLHYVSDIFVMGGCLILETLALLNWCERIGFGPLGVSGISMGGHMASLAASNWPKPLVLVPCLSWSTASSVFTEGVMSESIDWDMLQKQLFSNKIYCDTLSKSCKIVDSPFACTLSRIPGLSLQKLTEVCQCGIAEYGLTSLLKQKCDVGYISPYEMMNLLDSTNCPAISYKHSSQNVKVESGEYSVLNLPIFNFSREITDMRKRDKEAIWFMRGMMDEFTHLKNFSVPYEPSLIIAVCAESDGYVPRVGISKLDEIWPGATIKYVDTGHVGAYIWHRKLFRNCIIEAFEKAKKIVPPPGPYFEN